MKTVFIPVWMLAVAWTTLACGWFEGRKSDDSVVGIHLGSSYASVGIYQDGEVHIIPDDEGSRLMPTFVAFTRDGEHLIGRAAKDYLLTNPENTVFDVKRLIGRKWNDTVVQKNIKKYPFRVINKNDKPHIVVGVGNEENKIMTSEEISAMILGKLKETAEAYLGKEVKSAVIAVPAYFNDAQRQATTKAAAMVGINVLRIYNEPAAAAVAYGLHQVEGETNILVFSLGGRTCDVTVMDSDTGVLDVLSVDVNMDLGGETFDERVVEHFIKRYKKKKGKDIRGDNRAVQKLRREVEKAKRGLSSQHQARVEVESMFEGEDFSETLTRAKFEELNMDLFQSAVGLIPRALAQADLTREDINEILLVGGSTSIPKIRQLLTEFFGGKELSRSIDPQEVVTYGAAVFGGKVENDIILCDFTPLSYGIETAGGLMATIIPRNTMGIVRKSEIFSTASENQSAVMVKVYQGERTMVRDNQYLGVLNLTGIEPAPRGGPQIEVTFETDANMMLKVSVEDKGSGNYNEILIDNEIMALTPEEIEHMLVEAEEFAEKDKIAKEVAEDRIKEDSFPFSLLRQPTSMEGQAPQQEMRQREENNNKEEL